MHPTPLDVSLFIGLRRFLRQNREKLRRATFYGVFTLDEKKALEGFTHMLTGNEIAHHNVSGLFGYTGTIVIFYNEQQNKNLAAGCRLADLTGGIMLRQWGPFDFTDEDNIKSSLKRVVKNRTKGGDLEGSD